MFTYRFHCRLYNERTGEITMRRGSLVSESELVSAEPIRVSVRKALGEIDEDSIVSILHFSLLL